MELNQGWIYRDRITARYQGWAVLDYYSERYPHSSRGDWGDRLHHGQIYLNGQPTTATTGLIAGQTLTYHRPPWIEPLAPLDFTLLHSDPDFLLIAKPSGLPVLPGGGYLEHTLLFQLKQQYPDIAPIHRLGRGTSGIMLWARTPLARQELSRQIREREMVKIYRALVADWSHGERLTITQPIGKLPHPALGTVYGATTEGMAAESRVEVVGEKAGVILAVTIPTGRPHQIRIHLAAAGHPLLGDPLYCVGGGLNLEPVNGIYPVPGDCGYWLHAHYLSFHHPRTGEPLTFHCPPPARLTPHPPAPSPRKGEGEPDS